jgi:putative flippase GtrA
LNSSSSGSHQAREAEIPPGTRKIEQDVLGMLSTAIRLIHDDNITNFQLNRSWTFKREYRRGWWREFWPFFAVGSIAAIIGMFIKIFFTNPTSPIYLPVERPRTIELEVCNVGYHETDEPHQAREAEIPPGTRKIEQDVLGMLSTAIRLIHDIISRVITEPTAPTRRRIKKRHLIEFIKFGVVGGSGFLVNIIVAIIMNKANGGTYNRPNAKRSETAHQD